MLNRFVVPMGNVFFATDIKPLGHWSKTSVTKCWCQSCINISDNACELHPHTASWKWFLCWNTGWTIIVKVHHVQTVHLILVSDELSFCLVTPFYQQLIKYICNVNINLWS